MDPYGTGFVSKEEFRDILTELCVHLSEYELNLLTRKFEVGSDGRWVLEFFLFKIKYTHLNNTNSMRAEDWICFHPRITVIMLV